MRSDKFDPELLDSALAERVQSAQAARDCFVMGDEPEVKPLPKRWRLRARCVLESFHGRTPRNAALMISSALDPAVTALTRTWAWRLGNPRVTSAAMLSSLTWGSSWNGGGALVATVVALAGAMVTSREVSTSLAGVLPRAHRP
jgi:hypothetical protein